MANRHLARRQHVIVYGPSRIRRLRRLARPPVPRYTFLVFAAGVTAGFGLLAAGRAGLSLIAFGLPLLVVLPVLTALWTRRVVILDGHEEITWRAAQRAYENADRFALQVLPLFPDEDPRDVLRRSRMELAHLLAERRRLRVAWREATTAGDGLAYGDPLRDRLAQRAADLEERIAALGAEAGRRTDSFTSLATVWGEFVWQRDQTERRLRAARRAEQVLSRVDDTLDQGLPPAANEAADLAERSAAVLDAYRELRDNLRRAE